MLLHVAHFQFIASVINYVWLVCMYVKIFLIFSFKLNQKYFFCFLCFFLLKFFYTLNIFALFLLLINHFLLSVWNFVFFIHQIQITFKDLQHLTSVYAVFFSFFFFFFLGEFFFLCSLVLEELNVKFKSSTATLSKKKKRIFITQ